MGIFLLIYLIGFIASFIFDFFAYHEDTMLNYAVGLLMSIFWPITWLVVIYELLRTKKNKEKYE